MAANNLAYIMVENGQNVDVALSLAQTARRNAPNPPDTADTLAWVYYYKQNYSAARDLESALQTAPDNASMHFHLGMVYSKLNDKTDAQTHLKKAVVLAPNSKVGKDASCQARETRLAHFYGGAARSQLTVEWCFDFLRP